MFTQLLTTNSNIRKITGVDKFHKAGYYGERVSVASGECWNLDLYNPDGLCNNPTNSTTFSYHGLETAACFFQVAPKARLTMFNSSGRFGSNTYDCKIMNEAFPYIENSDIILMFTSLSPTGNKKFREDYAKKMQALTYFCSCWPAGNNGAGSFNRMLEIEEITGVGGFILNNGHLQISGNSGSSNNANLIDFSAPFNVHYQIQPGMDALCSGTSAATPWLCGMMALIDDFFIDKTGKPLTRDKMIEFLKEHCKDIEDKGMDKRSGWGIPCLPEPSDIDIAKYATVVNPVEPDPDPGSTPEPENPEPTYPDVSDWAFNAWNKATQNGIIDGTRPKDNITREEAVVILDRLEMLE